MDMKVAVLSYVCDAMIPFVEASTTMLVSDGHKIVSREQAELWIIASCSLTSSIERKINDMLAEARLRNKKVLLLGCMAEVEEEHIVNRFNDVSIAGITSYMHLPDIVKKIASGYRVHRISDSPKQPFLKHILRINPLVAYIPVSEGCSSKCKFCICRIARGSQVSYPAEKVVEAVQLAVNSGAKEIVLVGDDVASYFNEGFSLPSLLRKICTISGDFKIKLGYMNPASFLKVAEDLISAISHPKVYKYVHLNLQSASNSVLKSMGRSYTKEEFMMLVKTLRKHYPNMTLETDVIVGYPAEQDEDFAQTKMFLNEIKPDIINVHAFSKRPHMKSEEEVPSWKIKERYEDLLRLKNKLEAESLKRWMGWEGEVVIVEKHDGFLVGRNFAYRNVLLKRGSLGAKANVAVRGVHNDYLVA